MKNKRPTSIKDTEADAAGAQVHSSAPTNRVRRRLGRALLVGLAVVMALLVGVMLAGSKNPRHVPARVFMTTLMGFQHQTPGPWPEGNHFSLASRATQILLGLHGPVGNFVREYAPNCLTGGRGGWAVINMHTENFSEIVRQLKLESVEILMVDKRACLVVDPRIPREWFLQLSSASQSRPPALQHAAADYPDKFSLPADAPNITSPPNERAKTNHLMP